MTKHPHVQMMDRYAADVLAVAQTVQSVLSENQTFGETEIATVNQAAATLIGMAGQCLDEAKQFKGRTETTTTYFVDGLRLMGAACLRIAAGLKDQDGDAIRMGHFFWVQGSGQVRKAYERSGEEPPTLTLQAENGTDAGEGVAGGGGMDA